MHCREALPEAEVKVVVPDKWLVAPFEGVDVDDAPWEFDVVEEKVGDSAELSIELEDVAMPCVVEVLDRAGEGAE